MEDEDPRAAQLLAELDALDVGTVVLHRIILHHGLTGSGDLVLGNSFPSGSSTWSRLRQSPSRSSSGPMVSDACGVWCRGCMSRRCPLRMLRWCVRWTSYRLPV